MIRREFIAGLAAGAVGGFALSRLPASTEPKWDAEADVVIVGGGAAGCTAALSAVDAGANVIVLESAPVLGGAGSLCIGSVTVPLSGLQKKAGIVDNADDYMEDIMHRAGAMGSRMDKALLRVLAENGGATIDWLMAAGVDIRGPFEFPQAHRVKRMHMLYPKSAEWPKVIRPILDRKGVDIRFETQGIELYRNEAGRIVGVKALDRNTRRTLNLRASRAVMLTAGSVEANPAMLGRFMRPEVAHLQPANHWREGDGLKMAAAVGAEMTVFDFVTKPEVRGWPPGPSAASLKRERWLPYSMVDAGAILVNNRGERFIVETASNEQLALTLEDQPYKAGYVIFDSLVANLFNKWPMIVSSLPGIGDVSGIGGFGTVDDLIARGGIRKASSLEALAKVTGIDPQGLAAGVARWNSHCQAGVDPDFQRTTFGHPEAKTVGAGIRVPPFYCHSPLKALLMPGDVSVLINTRMQVLDVFGKVIPGLYAGGDMGHGNMLLTVTGHGVRMGWAFTSGRLGGGFAANDEA
jgi:fumarate reductase flavoprotein subunit